MRTLFTIGLIMIAFFAQAQSPYNGGSGDGHAMGKLELRPLTTAPQAVQTWSIYPSLLVTGTPIQVTGSNVANLSYRILTISGQVLANDQLAEQNIASSGLDAGLYFIELNDGIYRKVFRITILE